MRKLLFATTLFFIPLFTRADELLPTKDGTTWEYNATETITGSAPKNSIVTIRAGKQLLDGKEVAKLETLSSNVLSKTELVSPDEKGIVSLARIDKDGKLVKLNPPERIIATPLRVGAAWETGSEVEGIRIQKPCTVMAEENVSVPAGNFRAFHLHSENLSLISAKLDRWFVPGTGFVKETSVVKGPGMLQRRTLELKKFTIADATKPTAQAPESSPSTSPSGSPKKLTVEVASDPAGGMKTEFMSDVPHIYVRWFGHDLPENARVRVAWVVEDVGELVEPNFIIDETETIAPVPNATARFTLGRPPDGWAEGKYRLEFYIDDILTETVRVTIK